MERTFSFSKRRIEAIPTPEKMTEYRDDRTPGLVLMALPSGVKTFYWRRHANGRNLRVSIGKFPAVTVEKAREAAAKYNGALAGGDDPVKKKKAAKVERVAAQARAVTLRQVFDAFKQSRHLKPRTLYQYDKFMERGFGDWLDKPLVDITDEKVSKRHRRLGKGSGQAYANGACRVLRSVCGFAMIRHRGLLTANPVKVLSEEKAWYHVGRRERTIPDTKVGPLLRALDDCRAADQPTALQVGADYIELVMLTGLRRSEAAGLTWDDVDLDEGIIRIPDTKAKRPHSLPVTSAMRIVLERRQQQRRKGETYVFPSAAKRGVPIAEPRYMTDHLGEKIGVEFSVHDLRRLFATVAEQRIRASYLAVKRMLNHSTASDVTSGYVTMGVDDLREPMQAISDWYMVRKAEAQGMKLAAAAG